MNCPACNQETERSGAEYWLSHLRALESLRLAFEKWTIAYENLTLPDPLERVQKAPGIELRVKEIARLLSESPSRWR